MGSGLFYWYNDVMTESEATFGPPAPPRYEAGHLELGESGGFIADFGEPDAFGRGILLAIREKGRFLVANGHPRAYLHAVYEVLSAAQKNGSWVPHETSAFVDGIGLATAELMDSQGGDAVLAMLIESISEPPDAMAA
jgi:hypothetical protein